MGLIVRIPEKEWPGGTHIIKVLEFRDWRVTERYKVESILNGHVICRYAGAEVMWNDEEVGLAHALALAFDLPFEWPEVIEVTPRKEGSR